MFQAHHLSPGAPMAWTLAGTLERVKHNWGLKHLLQREMLKPGSLIPQSPHHPQGQLVSEGTARNGAPYHSLIAGEEMPCTPRPVSQSLPAALASPTAAARRPTKAGSENAATHTVESVRSGDKPEPPPAGSLPPYLGWALRELTQMLTHFARQVAHELLPWGTARTQRPGWLQHNLHYSSASSCHHRQGSRSRP